MPLLMRFAFGSRDHNQIARDTVTLVFDKGTAALANTVELEEAGVGWISALPWNHAPAELRERAVEQLPPCSSQQPGVRAAGEKLLVHGKEYLCVVKYSASFAGEQLHSLTTSMSKVLQYLRRFSMELNKPQSPMGGEEDSQQDSALALGPIPDGGNPLRPPTARRPLASPV